MAGTLLGAGMKQRQDRVSVLWGTDPEETPKNSITETSRCMDIAASAAAMS